MLKLSYHGRTVRGSLVSLFAAAFIATAGPSFAQSTTQPAIEDMEGATTLDTELLLNAPVITATGREQSRALAPANVVTWERAELLRHGWTTLAQVLANTPGLYVIDDLVLPSLGVRGVNPGLRGGTRLVRIMINGVQVNFRSDLTAFLQSEYIPFTAVERIEIAKGPLSALYGANAFLATVNVITVKPVEGLQGELGGNAQFIRGNGGGGGGGTAGFGTKNLSALFAYDLQSVDRSGLTLHRTFAGQDPASANYAGFFGRNTENDLSKPSSLYGFVEGRSASLGVLQLQGGRQVLDARNNFQPNSVITNRSRTSLYNNWASASYIYGYGDAVTLSLNGALSKGSNRDQDQFYITNDPRFRYERTYGYDAYELGAAFEARLPAQLELKIGTDYEANTYDGLFFTQIYEQIVGQSLPGTIVPRGTPRSDKLTDWGLYGQLGGNPFSSLPDLYLLGNLRFDSPNLFDNQLSWRGGLAYQFSPRFITKLFAGRAFQIPTATQLFAQPGFGPSYNVIGSEALPGLPTLQPQSIFSVELATTYSVTNTVVIDAAVYYQEVRDKISFIQVSNNFAARNLADQDFLGGELGVRASSSRLAGYAYGSAQLTNDDVDQDGTATFALHAPSEFPVATLFAGSTLFLPEAYMAVDLTMRLVGPRGASQSNLLLNNRDNYTLNTYATFDLTLTSLDILIFGPKYETKIMVAFRNLFDARYSDPGHGGFDIPAIGRSIAFRLAQTF